MKSSPNYNLLRINLRRSRKPVNIYLKLFIILYADDTVILSESESDLQVDIRSKSTLKLVLFLFGQNLFVENNPKYHALCIVYHTICIRNKISILNG